MEGHTVEVLHVWCFVCGGVHYGEIEGLVSVERWSCSRGASCVMGTLWGDLGTGLCREVVL